eukprot:m.16998 g.16998  ORF g.16998 m.16998 type:complete len:759 (+) comp8201_c0_seq2:140-2416(+)
MSTTEGTTLDVLPRKLKKNVDELFGHNIHAVLKGWYLGSYAVMLDDPESQQTTTEVLGEHVLSALKRHETTKVLVVISDSYITLVSRANESIMQQIPSNTMDEYLIDERAKPMAFAFCFHSTKLNIDYVSTFQVKPKYELFVDPALDAIKGLKKTHRMSQIDPIQLGIQHRVLGTRMGFFLGSIAVAKKNGNDVCRAAADKLKRKHKQTRERLLSVAIVVTADSIRYAEMLVDETLADVLIKDVSFVTVLDEGQPDEIFAFVESDERLDHVICHIFSCARGDPDVLCEFVGKAQERARQQSEAKAADPFAPEFVSESPNLQELATFAIPRDSLTAVKVLGSGQFGTVWLANLANEASGFEEDDEISCAVKLLRTESTDNDVNEFRYECEIMKGLNHPNIVKLLGICFEARPWLAVFEMMNYGDLHKVLKTCKQKHLALTYLEQATLIEQAAAGMVYIAHQGIVHMDIAARNLLLHTDNNVKIADFGVAHHVDPQTKQYRLQGALKLPVRWMAPETLSSTRIYFSEKTDVYSFAVFMWEVFTYGTLPFMQLKARAAKDEIVGGLILSQPDACPDEMYDMMLQAWDKNPDRRPTFVDLHKFVRNVRLEQEQGDQQARDIGASLNALLTQNLRKLSMRASMVRRQSRKNSSVSVASVNVKRSSVVTSLATMTEETEEDDAVKAALPKEDENWSGTIKRKKSFRQRAPSSTSSLTTAGPLKVKEPITADPHGQLVRRDSVEMDLNLFEDGTKFTEFGDTNRI